MRQHRLHCLRCAAPELPPLPWLPSLDLPATWPLGDLLMMGWLIGYPINDIRSEMC